MFVLPAEVPLSAAAAAPPPSSPALQPVAAPSCCSRSIRNRTPGSSRRGSGRSRASIIVLLPGIAGTGTQAPPIARPALKSSARICSEGCPARHILMEGSLHATVATSAERSRTQTQTNLGIVIENVLQSQTLWRHHDHLYFGFLNLCTLLQCLPICLPITCVKSLDRPRSGSLQLPSPCWTSDG